MLLGRERISACMSLQGGMCQLLSALTDPIAVVTCCGGGAANGGGGGGSCSPTLRRIRASQSAGPAPPLLVFANDCDCALCLFMSCLAGSFAPCFLSHESYSLSRLLGPVALHLHCPSKPKLTFSFCLTPPQPSQHRLRQAAAVLSRHSHQRALRPDNRRRCSHNGRD
jgi:hypothetical protein